LLSSVLLLSLIAIFVGSILAPESRNTPVAQLLCFGGAVVALVAVGLLIRNTRALHPKAKNSRGETWLMKAAEHGDVTTAKMLLFRGANVNAKDIDGQTALMRAAVNGDVGIVKVLLAHQANLNDKDFDGWNALDYAKSHGHREIVEMLQRATSQT
jgi:ankyrin repeat protein